MKTLTTKQIKKYLFDEISEMKIYLRQKRNIGDKRDKNIIYDEWIVKNAKSFRYEWLKKNKKSC